MSEKPDIVFIHGMWSRHTVWEGWTSLFRQMGFRCHAIDLPGHEERGSDVLLQGMALQHYVDAVVDAVTRLHRPVLLGHSLGGLIGQLVAQRLKIAGLVMINSAAPAQIFPLRLSMLPGLVRHFGKWALWRRSFRLSPWEANYLIFNRVGADERAALYELLIAESGMVAYEVGFGRLNLSHSNRVHKDSITCPMLSLAGGQDRIIPRSVSRRMVRWYGGRLDYWEYPSHGHWLLGESDWNLRAYNVAAWILSKCPVENGVVGSTS
ncbi:alpha/beta hydrolase [Pseudomonas sp. AOB-7]|uniref:alpha/beta fold hydrolase n=1 Tax=Pseudomonas sp. AOB-7 TaxID=2482750 RepID=UPI000EFA72E7|nr:alpha/beta hydrolase [Pseudomonas sp. AOB-7]RMH82366.1 alpha/beta hydrolase [Pseudomonas sp. AOB-7]